MTVVLADGNVLVALTVVDHVHHDVVRRWFVDVAPDLATCPITEGTLLRFLLRESTPTAEAAAALSKMRAQDWHTFWPDSLPYEAAHLAGVLGHRQVADAYLVALARSHRSKVVTLDRGLAALHGDHTILLSP